MAQHHQAEELKSIPSERKSSRANTGESHHHDHHAPQTERGRHHRLSSDPLIVDHEVYNQDAPEELLQHSRLTMVFDDPQVENQYLYFTIKSFFRLTILAALMGGVGIAATFLGDYDHVLWIGLSSYIAAACCVAISVLNFFLCSWNHDPEPTGYHDAVHLIKTNELLSNALLFVSLVFSFIGYAVDDMCYENYTTGREAQLAGAELNAERCVRKMYSISVVLQTIPIIALEFARSTTPNIIIVLHVVAYFAGRPYWGHDTTKELIAKVILRVALTICIVGGVRVKEFQFRRNFLRRIEMVRATQRFQQLRGKVSETLYQLAPPPILEQAFQGKPPVDNARTCTIMVTRIDDFARWSCTVLPEVLVRTIDKLFSCYDAVINTHFQLNKLKTVGDCYVTGCDLWPVDSETQPCADDAEGAKNRHKDLHNPVTESLSEKEDARRNKGHYTGNLLKFALYQLRTAVKVDAVTPSPMGKTLDTTLRLKIGVHTDVCCGFLAAVPSLLWYEVGGPAYDVAAALCEVAPAGQVLTTPATLSLAQGSFEGKHGPEVVVRHDVGTATIYQTILMTLRMKKPSFEHPSEEPPHLSEGSESVASRGLLSGGSSEGSVESPSAMARKLLGRGGSGSSTFSFPAVSPSSLDTPSSLSSALFRKEFPSPSPPATSPPPTPHHAVISTQTTTSVKDSTFFAELFRLTSAAAASSAEQKRHSSMSSDSDVESSGSEGSIKTPSVGTAGEEEDEEISQCPASIDVGSIGDHDEQGTTSGGKQEVFIGRGYVEALVRSLEEEQSLRKGETKLERVLKLYDLSFANEDIEEAYQRFVQEYAKENLLLYAWVPMLIMLVLFTALLLANSVAWYAKHPTIALATVNVLLYTVFVALLAVGFGAGEQRQRSVITTFCVRLSQFPYVDALSTMLAGSLTFLSLALAQHSMLATHVGWLHYSLLAYVHISAIRYNYRWMAACCAVFTIEAAVVLSLRWQQEGALVITIAGGLLSMVSAHWLETRYRETFQDRYIASLYTTAARQELTLQRGFLAMIVPSALVDTLLAKEGRERGAIIESLGNVAVAVLRLDDCFCCCWGSGPTASLGCHHHNTEASIGHRSPPRDDPGILERMLVLQSYQAFVIELCAVYGENKIEKIYIAGDRILLAGSILEHPKLTQKLAADSRRLSRSRGKDPVKPPKHHAAHHHAAKGKKKEYIPMQTDIVLGRQSSKESSEDDSPAPGIAAPGGLGGTELLPRMASGRMKKAPPNPLSIKSPADEEPASAKEEGHSLGSSSAVFPSPSSGSPTPKTPTAPAFLDENPMSDEEYDAVVSPFLFSPSERKMESPATAAALRHHIDLEPRFHAQERKKQHKAFRRKQEDSLLKAAVALLDVVQCVTSHCDHLSAMLHCSDAFAAVLGVQRPTFALLGPATRTAEALLSVAPPRTVAMTNAFDRLLHNGRIQLPRRSSAQCGIFVPGTEVAWRVRGEGIVYVVPLLKHPVAAVGSGDKEEEVEEGNGTPIIPSVESANAASYPAATIEEVAQEQE